MAKINFFALPRPNPSVHDVTLTDPSQPGVSVALRVSYLPGIEFDAKREALESELVSKYVTGANDMPPFPLPPLQEGGEPVPVSEDLCLYASYLLTMGVSDPEEGLYSFEQIAAFAFTCQPAFKRVVRWVSAVMNEGEPKNSPAASENGSSLPPSGTSTQPVTPTSSGAPTASSSPSTG